MWTCGTIPKLTSSKVDFIEHSWAFAEINSRTQGKTKLGQHVLRQSATALPNVLQLPTREDPHTLFTHCTADPCFLVLDLAVLLY